LSASGNVTLSGGTANGVLYLNGSKVATSGSGFAFDGTNLAIGTGTFSTIGGQLATLSLGGTNTTVSGGIAYQVNGSVKAFHYVENNILNHQAQSGVSQAFLVNGSEAMRLTSTGLGIGTSSPGAKLDVNGSIYAGGAVALSINSAGSNYGQIGYNTGVGDVYWLGYGNSKTSAGTAVLNWNSSGNLGLGVTPSAWNSSYKAFQNVAGALVGITAAEQVLTNNAYVSSSGLYTYSNTAAASRYSLYNGGHIWFTAASGTAGDAITFTQAMTLDASGNLALGVTSSSQRFRAEVSRQTG
jgi:hypothetical protein